MNIYVTGGEVSGPKIQGKVLPVGGDRFTLRPDGIGVLNVRATIKTDDDVLIYVSYHGITDLGEDAYNNSLKGETTPQELYILTNSRFCQHSVTHKTFQFI